MQYTRMIVTTCGPTSCAGHLQEQLAECGAEVAHSFRLIPGVAATMTPEALKRFLVSFPDAKVIPDRQRQLPPIPFGADDWAEVAGPGEPIATSPGKPHVSPLAVDLIGAAKVHSLGIDGSGVRVCIIDSGVDFYHPDLQGTAILGPDSMPLAADFTETDLTDTMGHGTAVAGCVAAQAVQVHTIRDDQTGQPVAYTRIKGIAPGARLMSAKVFDTRVSSGYDSTIIAALEWAAEQGAQIVNLSLGGVSLPNDGTDPLGAAVTALREQGILVVVASGNEGSGIGTLKSPGSSPGALTVGASTMFRSFGELGYLSSPDKWTADQLAGFSSLGPSADGRVKPEILAPGAYDWGLAPTLPAEEGQHFQLFGGTSQAAPLMAGAAALVHQAFQKAQSRNPTPEELIPLVTATAMDLGLPANMQGAGRVNVLKAVQAALGEEPVMTVTPFGPVVVEPGRSGAMEVQVRNAGPSPVELSPKAERFVAAKSLSASFHGEISVAQSPQFIHFQVEPGTDLMQVSLDWPSRAHGPQSPRLLLAVYDSEGRFVNYHGPSVTGEKELGRSVDTWITRPAPGPWSARITLRGGGRDTLQSFTLSIRAFRRALWDWVAASLPDEQIGILAPGESRQVGLTVTVPEGTTAGTYTGYLLMEQCGVIPLSVLVPIPLERGEGTFAGQFQHGYQGSWGNGDWIYHDLPVPADTEALIASVQWPDVDNAVEFYLINPAGQTVAARSNSEEILVDGSSTILGSQILHSDPEPGIWRLLLHSFAFCGRGMPEPYFGTVEARERLLSPDSITLRARPGERAPMAVFVRNPGRMPLTVQAVAMGNEPCLIWQNLTGEIKSGVTTEGKAEGKGHISLGTIQVPHGAKQIGVILSWDQADTVLSVTLYDPVSRRTTAAKVEGQLMLIETSPVPGEWSVIAGITTPGVETRTVKLTGAIYVVAPSVLTLVETPTVTIQPGSHGVLPIAIEAAKVQTTGRIVITTSRGDRLGEIPFSVTPAEQRMHK